MPPEKIVMLLNLGRQRPEILDALDRKQFAHLLESNLGIAACNDLSHGFARLRDDRFRLT